MKLTYQVYHFDADRFGQVETREREIDVDKALENNAFYNLLKRQQSKSSSGKPKKARKRRS